MDTGSQPAVICKSELVILTGFIIRERDHTVVAVGKLIAVAQAMAVAEGESIDVGFKYYLTG